MMRVSPPNPRRVVRVPSKADEWGLLNKHHDVQVGWVRQEEDGWNLFDMYHAKVAGPFKSARKAMAVAQSHDAFATHGNPGW